MRFLYLSIIIMLVHCKQLYHNLYTPFNTSYQTHKKIIKKKQMLACLKKIEPNIKTCLCGLKKDFPFACLCDTFFFSVCSCCADKNQQSLLCRRRRRRRRRLVRPAKKCFFFFFVLFGFFLSQLLNWAAAINWKH